jgi:cytochrome c2
MTPLTRCTVIAVVSIALLGGTSSGSGQLRTIPGSVARGEQVVTNNGCLNCHSLNGKGGSRAPDLSMRSKSAETPSAFASSLWNHAPAMLAEFEASGTRIPELRQTEVADLFAYFYATLYFSTQGNAARGGKVFAEKSCVNCHSEILNTESKKSIAETWMDLNDPSTWAERMWNHSAEMVSATSNRGISWPVMSDQELADLIQFLSTRAGTKSEAASFTIGEPELGQAVFDRSCADCHSLGRAEKSKVDLLSRKGAPTITGYIAAMWNHAPTMKRRGGGIATLKMGDMPNLVAFLFSQRYFFEPGDVKRGKQVFESKNCARCHETQRSQTGAPDLTKSVEEFSPVTLTAAAFRHGLPMIRSMKTQGLAWPELHNHEMADLISYLNSRLIVRVATQRD